MPVGTNLESILARARQSDIEKFREKSLKDDAMRDAAMKERGLKTLSNLVEESQANVFMDYGEMGTGSIDPLEEPIKVETTEGQQPLTGKEMMDKFLEKLK